MSVTLKWITPDAERLLVEMARVSNTGTPRATDAQLIGYLIRNRHWSPFEMVNICFEVHTSRDIARQMLRHSTMRPQEFSQRYADPTQLDGPVYRSARLQDASNRQKSLPCEDSSLEVWWAAQQIATWSAAKATYEGAIERGIAKEVARTILPEGMTPTRLFFNAPVRSALHFCALRSGHGSQSEIQGIAGDLYDLMREHLPSTCEAFDQHGEWETPQ